MGSKWICALRNVLLKWNIYPCYICFNLTIGPSDFESCITISCVYVLLYVTSHLKAQNLFLGHEWGDLRMIFTIRHEWKSLANRITSDPKIVIHGNECILLFLTRYFMSLEHTILLKTIIDRSFRNCRQKRPFLTSLCDVTRVDRWRHANARY